MADVARDTDSKARIQGVKAQMNTFRFAFGTMLAEMILRHTDNLSRSLQDKVCSATEGQSIGAMVVDTLQSLRNDSYFELFWCKVTSFTEPLDIEPSLPRQSKVPRRYESGTAEGHVHQSVHDLYRKDYFEAIDLAVNCIQHQFQQAGYEVYKNLEQLLLKAAISSDFSAEFTFVTSFYGEDLQAESLRAQLLTLAIEFK